MGEAQAPGLNEAAAAARRADLADFLRTLAGRSPHTLAAYTRDLEQFLAWLDAEGVGEWGEVDIHCLRTYVASRHRGGLGGASLARALSAMRAWFRHLAARGLLKANPAQGLRAPKSPRRLPRALDVDQVTRVLEQDTDSVLALRDQAMWETLYSCGLRVSELVGLNLTDVDLRSPGEALRYLPRALGIGLFAPFPWQWQRLRPLPLRLLCGGEMLVLYGLQAAAFAGLLRRRRAATAPLWVCFLGSAVALGLVVANTGALYRLRYGALLCIAVLAAGPLALPFAALVRRCRL